MAVRRLYVEKKSGFNVRSKELLAEIKNYLGLKNIKEVRELIRYDVENVSDETFDKSKFTIFAEAPIDNLYEENIPELNGGKAFSIEYLPGQFDQRADSAEQCVKLLNEKEEPVIRCATTYIINGDNVSDEDIEKIKNNVINPVDSRVAAEEKPETLVDNFESPADVKIMEGFISESDDKLKELYGSLSLAMTFKDFLFIRDYFKNEEKRDPSITEIRMLDTYWSDHCRHTTFLTELTDVKFGEGEYKKAIEDTYNEYKADFAELYKDRNDKYTSLMDVATIAVKALRKQGKLQDMEISDEINACSIIVPVETNGKTEEWLVFFKNETHNHPTEIEPFGGAATCLGGAIRDPLSGRGYVYQAMRVTGAADPTKHIKDTMEGKLPQRKLVTGAANGYSSYGNQIGLATGVVSEIYHPDYAAKRMEIGAVMGAAPRKHVKRENSDPGDIIILMGGRTGRDGCGGATGSSKAHTTESIHVCGAEVQKGNPPTERKLQRLFRRPEVTSLIKKCNDFGAGGVSVAIGELADGLIVNLDKVPKKYAGLDGTELAISESQERMAIVVDKKDVDAMLAYAREENLEATVVAEVTKEPRLVLQWRGKDVVNISRAFLNTNGAHQETTAFVEIPDANADYMKNGAPYEAVSVRSEKKAVYRGALEASGVDEAKALEVAESYAKEETAKRQALAADYVDSIKEKAGSVKDTEAVEKAIVENAEKALADAVKGISADAVKIAEEAEDAAFGKEGSFRNKLLAAASDLNGCSQKGLVERFDSSIGASTVLMPYGGKYQMTPIQTMVAKLPMSYEQESGNNSETVTMMSYGFDPFLSSWSPYHGSQYAVIESVAKIIAAGGELSKIYFTFQEYFRRMDSDPKHWGEPLAALLGAYKAQKRLGLASIGGKDSMSGTFNDIHVPSTLTSFAVDIADAKDVISPEFKKAGNVVVRFLMPRDEYNCPDYAPTMKLYNLITKEIRKGNIVSAYAVGGKGAAHSATLMSLGNRIGVDFKGEDLSSLFLPGYGDIIAEVSKAQAKLLVRDFVNAGFKTEEIAELTEKQAYSFNGEVVPMADVLKSYENTLEKVFPMHSRAIDESEKFDSKLFDAKKDEKYSGIYIAKNKVAKPHVFIPVFPGTNCEYDSAKAFERAGAETEVIVYNNLDEAGIRDSVEAFEKAINRSQIVMFPGGFSAGDEPDGSGKFIEAAFRNPRLSEAVNNLLKQRDGLVLGVCNGFQAIIKLGLVPYGEIVPQGDDSPTLARNNIGRHISKSVYTKVVSNKSPWLVKAELGKTYSIPASHGEGKFVANEEWLKKLFANGQVATQYVDVDGNPTMEEAFNPNGSFCAIEGILSPDGHVLGKMAHIERRGSSVAINIAGDQDMHIFESGVAYFQ